MAFEFCCFISYPHGQKDYLKPYIKNFVKGLENEVYAQTKKKIFVDYDCLEGGNWLDEKIGPSICKSVCMIFLYTPLYFDTEHTYCARELKAMELIEKQRMDLLKDKSNGLIIPIILRGPKRFPEAIKKRRIYYDFNDIEYNDPNVTISTKFPKEIKKIAEYIIDRCYDLKAIENHQHNCDAYPMPSEQEAIEFVETVLGEKIVDAPVNFVNRTETSTNG